MKYVPPGFDAARVRDGLRLAMGFGEPNVIADKATFYTVAEAPTTPADSEGVPFDPTGDRGRTPTSQTVTCVVAISDSADQSETFGVRRPSAIEITLLDEEYVLIKGFSFVVVGGDRYYYRSTEPPAGLGSIDVWTIHCRSLDEG